MTTFVMTVARKRALRAVEAGDIKRRYSSNGNQFLRTKGINARVIWHLLQFKLIEDGPSRGNIAVMKLTDAGKEVLNEN